MVLLYRPQCGYSASAGVALLTKRAVVVVVAMMATRDDGGRKSLLITMDICFEKYW